MAQRILALEMLGEVVRAAVAERSWNSFVLGGVFEEQRGDGEADLAPALLRLLARTGKPDIVISALPGEFVIKRLLELPFSNLHRLGQVVPFALEEHLPFPVDDAVVAFARVGNSGENTLVMAALARKPDLTRHLELLARARIDPRTVTLGALAVAALLARARGAAAKPRLVLDVEQSSTSLVLLDSDGTPRALRTVNTGLASGDEGSLSAASTAAIVAAVRQTLLAHSTGGEPTDIVLTGSGAGAGSLRKEIGQTFSLSVHDAAEFDYSFLLNGQRPDLGRFLGCIAMLVGEMPVGPAEMLNFRQGDFAFRGRVRGGLAGFYPTAILAAVAAIFIIVHFALGLGSSLARAHALERQIAAIAVPALGTAQQGDSVAALRSGILKMNRRLALIGAGTVATSPLDALLAVSRDVPKRFPVEMHDVAINEEGVKLSGQADSFGTVDQVKKALGRDHYFGAIQVSHAKAAADGKVEFQLDLTFRDALGVSR
jgi:hypothetical protein